MGMPMSKLKLGFRVCERASKDKHEPNLDVKNVYNVCMDAEPREDGVFRKVPASEFIDISDAISE